MVIDDGIKNRTHRENIFSDKLKFMGPCHGPHSKYDHMDVITYKGEATQGLIQNEVKKPSDVTSNKSSADSNKEMDGFAPISGFSVVPSGTYSLAQSTNQAEELSTITSE